MARKKISNYRSLGLSIYPYRGKVRLLKKGKTIYKLYATTYIGDDAHTYADYITQETGKKPKVTSISLASLGKARGFAEKLFGRQYYIWVETKRKLLHKRK